MFEKIGQRAEHFASRLHRRAFFGKVAEITLPLARPSQRSWLRQDARKRLDGALGIVAMTPAATQSVKPGADPVAQRAHNPVLASPAKIGRSAANGSMC
jgi:hypothetical protein